MADFTHYLQGDTDTEITDSDTLQFAAGDFDSKITVGEYNGSTHVKDDNDSDASDGNTPNNNNYDDASLPLDDSDCALNINFAHDQDIETEDAIFYAYDGSETSNGPDGVTFYAAESGDDDWTNAEGSGDALDLADNTSAAGDHNFYIAVSASPDSVGAKTGKYRIELTYF